MSVCVVFAPGVNAGGGAEVTAVLAAAGYARAGYRTVLFTDAPVERAWAENHFGCSLDGVELETLPPEPRWAHRLPEALRIIVRDLGWARRMRREDPDVFISLKYKSLMPGLGRQSVNYVHFPHPLRLQPRGRLHACYLAGIRSLRRAILHPRSRSYLGTYDRFLANSRFTGRNIERYWGVEADVVSPPCRLVGPGAASDRTKTIVSVGRFQPPTPNTPQKNQHILVEAFARAETLRRDGWKLVLAGATTDSPEGREYLEQLRISAEGLPIELRTDLSREGLDELLRTASVYWHAQGFGTSAEDQPMMQEHFGISVVEAMSAGLIPLVYASGGPAEIVADLDGERTWRTLDELVERTERVALAGDAEQVADDAVRAAQRYSEERFLQEIVEAGRLPGL